MIKIEKLTFNKLMSFFSDWGFTWSGLKNNKKGEWLLISQLLIIGVHLLPITNNSLSTTNKEILIVNVCGVLILTSGLATIIRSIISLGNNISPLPFPKKGARLIQVKSYQNCRHPLYKGLIFCSLGICLIKLSILHLLLLISLIYILKEKAKVEEKFLESRYPAYKEYRESTPGIIKNMIYLDWK